MGVAQPRWRLGHRPALDGLRGVAVLVVVADHAGFLREPAGGIGVTVFFVLSGFLITRVIVEAHQSGTWSMAGFLANRFVRLFPALLVMVSVVSTVLLVQGHQIAWVASRALPALAYVQNMTPRRSFPVFDHTWSLGVEEQFYLLWPLALPLVLRLRRLPAALGTAIAASAALAITLQHDWLPMHAYALLAGCALALVGPVPAKPWLVPLGALEVVGAIALAPYVEPIYVYGPMMAMPGAVLLVAGASTHSRPLEAPALRFTGRISYALYLWHVPLLRLTGTTYAGVAALAPVIASVLLAVASTVLLEEPLRRAWRRRRSGAAPRAEAPPGSVAGTAAGPRLRWMSARPSSRTEGHA
jgi:peptidoglycan/LPS O-acetylase OafA/YrhL